ncbi:hypothetical protein NLG97_g3211 [Lecanicillium saksenae]|uniref:Uncharacterized protein n=1 Tax=Lecanicillium saksenae TaxID=468837 RepID=A0ACC1R003_9HYPO|nr:hypothetical protein NLG97_g3211 [Lecanicillium saksenae]
MKLSAAASFIFLALTSVCDAVTTRTALVTVENASQNNLMSVSLLHKYSDVFNNAIQYPIIHAADWGGDYMQAQYHTGITTTGRDWWLLTWFSEDLQWQYYTHPNNFRSVFDALDKAAPDAIDAVIGAAAALISSESGPVGAAAVTVAVALAKEVADQVFNAETTDGFKQHILRSDDENYVTRIIVKDNGEVEFHSHSGVSTTNYIARRAQ